ncbi:SURF1 family protein [Roseateles sp. GG27B]
MVTVTDNTDHPERAAKPGLVLALLLVAALLFVGLLALGSWQIQRLSWKEALIARVEQQLQAPPVPVPGPSVWPTINRAADEYRRVQVNGRFDHSRETLVGASTELGSGFWVLTPLQTTAGFWVLINRGFIPTEQRNSRAERAETTGQSINGLLRLSEVGGTWLQANDAAAGRWYSRDVAAIAASKGLNLAAGAAVAPYFVDAAVSDERGATNTAAWPRAGLTVLNFHNNHVVYAVTWFVLAAMVAAAAGYLFWSERLLQRRQRVSARGSDDAADERNAIPDTTGR